MEFDKAQEVLYNSDNGNEPTSVRIDRRNLKPLNDATCAHDYRLDPNDPDAVMFDVYKCQFCIRGFLTEKS